MGSTGFTPQNSHSTLSSFRGLDQFGEPQKEYVCEETGDEVVLMKDKDGHVIGFERLNYPDAAQEPVRVLFESVGAASTAA